ncbi:SusD/RagB family nutrient-binding outer membrane lipoprotein [Bacteroides sp.]|uniref:SusD/RagB family nutrient-binding outer membrane lipoprotein n=1 Tax=Bacteroides sp. TaxID=29523 RepID=UPI00261B8027|nr:SusD/RagB family nutrient-binding outer membrane lipoprotein [Bacteroides sp.]MDD3037072.1 SusD/RagB family nutrient-binding outer membrane lipoprotein [Bacteroides sp.]
MKFKLYKPLALCTLIMGLTACHDFEELNTNPYAPVYNPEVIGATPDGIDIDYELSESALQSLQGTESAIGSVFANFTYEGVYNDYQVTTNLTHDFYAAYFANNVSGFVTDSPTYRYRDDWSKKRWEHFYDNRTVEEYSQLIKTFWFCGKDRYHNAFYITRIYYAFLLSMLTDTYGAVPVEYYVKGAMPTEEKVKYMDQKDVYDVIFQLLDQAIAKLHNTPATSQYSLGENDKCYGGDKEKWLRFANTLRLRLALRVSNVAPELAQEQGKKALEDPSGLMQNDDDNMKQTPKYSYITGGNENIYTLLYNWSANVVLSKEMEIAYKEQSTILDPRCEILWWRPTSLDALNQDEPKESDKDFNGCENGETALGGSYTTIYSPSRVFIKQDQRKLDRKHWWCYGREITWLGYSESLFLRAEAALRKWSAEDPKDLYLQGIRASFNYFEIGADKKGQDKIEKYIDNLKGLEAFNGTNKEEQLEQIITQKWIAVYPNGNEGWAEFRRTDYPRFMKTPKNGNNSGGEVPNGKFIKRLRYPDSEASNPNRPKAEDTQGTRLWWDIADTNNGSGTYQTPNNF